jgi:methionine-gamma-lyase
MTFDPAKQLQDFIALGEFGGVNPSISDSSTYTFPNVKAMQEAFDHEIEGCFLYSRLRSPTNKALSGALACMEDGEAAQVMASGMAAISAALLALCSAGDEIVSSRTIYGGTYALMKNLLPRFGVSTRFVDITDLSAVQAAISPNSRVLYCETTSNPLLEVADIPDLSRLAKNAEVPLLVDNTFSPLIFSPLRLGADVVIHSLTKFINGTSDCMGGCVISSEDFIARLNDPRHGPVMLLGPALDSLRAASILKNLNSLHIRMAKHGENALYLARQFQSAGLPVYYPGLESHPQHDLATNLMNPGFGFGGMIAVDVGDMERAGRLLMRLQESGVGYLAVSLGYFKTLFSAPGQSTSSEIPADEQQSIGLSEGLIRISVGLDNDIRKTWEVICTCLAEVGLSAAKPVPSINL